ncbi:hypothetical protein PANT_5c00085 [Moesziomyces antarcticus T-34]|uniref:DSC E3 ubiquitin ligase complex subunit 3 C-terminal domain-containing protein n=1 Tax=Pseudozyma antarctica (strain T-34) TaxID=1151754 RepID=M9LXV6_PSEA3|nr:hypothetical protein PANT_5c00085 [Moesziomyces antarcticus T-34]
MTDTLRRPSAEVHHAGSARLSASIRLRPVRVRFTEPGVRDLSLLLHSLISLRLVPSDGPASQHADVLFDAADPQAAVEEPHAAPAAGEVMALLAETGLTGDERVRAIKAHMEAVRDGVAGRRLRLIHAGRMLRDGVGLVGYLDELDARTRAQTRQGLRHLALDKHARRATALDAESSAESSNDEQQDDEEDERVERREMSVRQLVDWLTELQSHQHSIDSMDAASASRSGKGKGKAREPVWYDEAVRVVIRTAAPVYLQCSVGDVIPPASSPPAHIEPSNPFTDADTEAGEERRGFNRLLDAGLSAEEVEAMRAQFQQTQRVDAYDLIRSREHAAHLLELEESWMDSFGTAAPAEEASASYTSVMHGLLVGFFLPPLIPLFWFRDRPHPSSIPTSIAPDPDDLDDEQSAAAQHHALTRENVFSTTMQIAILCGIIAK